MVFALSIEGIVPLAASLDHPSPMARTEADAAVLVPCMTGAPEVIPLSPPPAPLAALAGGAYLAGQARRAEGTRAWQAFFADEQFDVILEPTVLALPPRHRGLLAAAWGHRAPTGAAERADGPRALDLPCHARRCQPSTRNAIPPSGLQQTHSTPHGHLGRCRTAGASTTCTRQRISNAAAATSTSTATAISFGNCSEGQRRRVSVGAGAHLGGTPLGSQTSPTITWQSPPRTSWPCFFIVEM